jgi:CheY-like chemotaxis protein
VSRWGWRILLADDDLIVQEAVRSAAAVAGHRVIAAVTGAQAIAMAVTMRPDLIVLDIEFPDADGRDVLVKLKADPRTAGIPVVIWSGRNNCDSDSRIALALGAEDYMQKNDARMLLCKLERVLLRFDESA